MKENYRIKEWIRAGEIRGKFTFSFEEVALAFPNHPEQAVRNALTRLVAKGMIISVYRGFYVVVPPQYMAKGFVPEIYYIEHLMKFLDKPYYICLLNAAEMYGAAHQRSQTFSVATTLPSVQKADNRKSRLNFLFRKDIPLHLTRTKNSETGVVTFSNPELTAVDLVQFQKRIGGLSRAATVLSELLEVVDFSLITKDILVYTSFAAIRRLGYITEEVLGEQEKADMLYKKLKEFDVRFLPTKLSTSKQCEHSITVSRWKIIVNTQIEIDEI